MTNVIKRIITGFVLGTLFWTVFTWCSPIVFSCMMVAILLQIIFFEWTNFFDPKKMLFWLIMPLYPVLPFLLIIDLNHNPTYHNLIFILFMIVFSFDTGSYITGQLFGTHPIWSLVSPGKTWEGFVGGIISACIGLSIVLWQKSLTLPLWFVICFTAIVCTLSVLGDLFESALKRRVHIKDSGDILPGHGGFLDRFDGILFAVFFFYLLKDALTPLFSA